MPNHRGSALPALISNRVTTIAVDSDHLTELNTRMRRIDLLSKLVAPVRLALVKSL